MEMIYNRLEGRNLLLAHCIETRSQVSDLRFEGINLGLSFRHFGSCLVRFFICRYVGRVRTRISEFAVLAQKMVSEMV